MSDPGSVESLFVNSVAGQAPQGQLDDQQGRSSAGNLNLGQFLDPQLSHLFGNASAPMGSHGTMSYTMPTSHSHQAWPPAEQSAAFVGQSGYGPMDGKRQMSRIDRIRTKMRTSSDICSAFEVIGTLSLDDALLQCSGEDDIRLLDRKTQGCIMKVQDAGGRSVSECFTWGMA